MFRQLCTPPVVKFKGMTTCLRNMVNITLKRRGDDYMKRWYFLLLLVLVTILLSGCGGDSSISPTEPAVWAVTVNSYTLTDWVDSSVPGYGYPSDPGYTWLLFNLTIKNLKKESNSINWFLDSFSYVTADGSTYSLRLQFNDPPGYIETYYNPEQTKQGFIAFEVPIETTITAGKLIWDPEEGETVIFTLQGIPPQSWMNWP